MPSVHEQMISVTATPVLNYQFGVTVTLARGAFLTASFTARRSDSEYEVLGIETGLPVKVTSRDFILPVASIVIDGNTVEPRVGDKLTVGTEEFEVMSLLNQPSAEAIPGGVEWLVHTKRIQ